MNFQKMLPFLLKNSVDFFKVDKSGKFAVEYVSNGIFMKMSFPPLIGSFLFMIQRMFNFGNHSKFDGVFVEKRFYFFDWPLQQNWWSKDVPVVVGRVVKFFLS